MASTNVSWSTSDVGMPVAWFLPTTKTVAVPGSARVVIHGRGYCPLIGAVSSRIAISSDDIMSAIVPGAESRVASARLLVPLAPSPLWHRVRAAGRARDGPPGPDG